MSNAPERIRLGALEIMSAQALERGPLTEYVRIDLHMAATDELARLRAENEALRMAMAGVRSIESDFRWESEKLQHIPTLTLMFVPVPYNSPNDAIGWRNRDTLRAVIESVWRESDQKEQGE